MDTPELMDLLARSYRTVKQRSLSLSPDLRLGEDLDLDSLDAIDLLAVIEEELGVEIIDSVSTDLEEVVTVGDFAACLQRVLP